MPTDFLSKIVEQKKQEIEAAKKRVPENRLWEEASVQRTRRPFLKQLERPGVNIIAEIKRASPSKGPICPDLDPARYASEYEAGGAAALSVLTDTPYFQGSFDDLKKARQTVNLPVLRKDFLISSYQIYESAVLEADAVLLIVRILSPEQLRDYLSLSKELALDVLVETHLPEEIETATRAGATLIGINNRNLSSFETNIETAMNMASLLESHQVGVAESGIQGREDIEKLQQAGIHNFLIGESLVRTSDPKAFLQKLRGK
jgi:indole-3-glycerol phosphate synthase